VASARSARATAALRAAAEMLGVTFRGAEPPDDDDEATGASGSLKPTAAQTQVNRRKEKKNKNQKPKNQKTVPHDIKITRERNEKRLKQSKFE
jgi:hypothetical protein